MLVLLFNNEFELLGLIVNFCETTVSWLWYQTLQCIVYVTVWSYVDGIVPDILPVIGFNDNSVSDVNSVVTSLVPVSS